MALARELDPSGVRTLGVLTKPDAVEEGCHAPWVDMLCGKRWVRGCICLRSSFEVCSVAGACGVLWGT